MRYKKYKPGDRIFYECYDGSIESDIVMSVEEMEHLSDKGFNIKYQWLGIDEHCGIENYNCIPLSSPKIKELKKKYKLYDKKKTEIFTSILKLLSDFTPTLQKELLKELQTSIVEA